MIDGVSILDLCATEMKLLRIVSEFSLPIFNLSNALKATKIVHEFFFGKPVLVKIIFFSSVKKMIFLKTFFFIFYIFYTMGMRERERERERERRPEFCSIHSF